MVMGMFGGIEKQARIELIQLYEEFIKNPKDESIKERALDLAQEYGARPVLSEEVSNAGWEATNMGIGRLSVEKAKKILKELKNDKIILKN